MRRLDRVVVAVVAVVAAVAVAVVVVATRGGSPAAGERGAAALRSPARPTSAPARRAPSPGLVLRAAGEGDGALADVAPGAAAFRRYTDDFVDAQAPAAREHMAREGLTLDETRELTYFAVLAVESQDWARVEALTGRAQPDAARREVWEAMMARSQEMRRHVQEEIARGGDEAARWDVIARVEGGYLSDYYRLTGMTPALLDQLLLASVRDQRVNETLASLAPSDEPPAAPPGARGALVRRDPLHPERPPVPVDEPPAP